MCVCASVFVLVQKHPVREMNGGNLILCMNGWMYVLQIWCWCWFFTRDKKHLFKSNMCVRITGQKDIIMIAILFGNMKRKGGTK